MGEDGLDVYSVSPESMKYFSFIFTLTKQDLFDNQEKAHMGDITAFSYRNKNYMFLIDYFQGIWLFEILETGKTLMVMKGIG